MNRPRLLLIGGGHAHVQILESLADAAWPPVDATLLSPDPDQFYTGMVPGFVQGQYDAADLTIDLPRLCAAAGVQLVVGLASRVRTESREVESTAGTLPFDLVSLDIGSTMRGVDLPGVREHALTLRPLARSVALREKVEALAKLDRPARVVVVGGGSGGVEIALAVHRRLVDAGGAHSVALVERGEQILDGYSGRVQTVARQLLDERGIAVHTGRSVESVHENGLRLEHGGAIEADLVVWVTGPAAPSLIRESGLPSTDDGFLRVSATLQASDGSPVWGAGDCVSLQGQEVPKAGVYAVRQGPVLAANLRAVLTGEPPSEYRPQSDFLSILNTADGKALLRWRSLVSHSRPAWWLKDWIDRRWIRRFS